MGRPKPGREAKAGVTPRRPESLTLLGGGWRRGQAGVRVLGAGAPASGSRPAGMVWALYKETLAKSGCMYRHREMASTECILHVHSKDIQQIDKKRSASSLFSCYFYNQKRTRQLFLFKKKKKKVNRPSFQPCYATYCLALENLL